MAPWSIPAVSINLTINLLEVFLISESAIFPRLLQSYMHADYHVDAEPIFVLKVGIFSPPLARLYQLNKCDCAAFLTASNPLSRDVGDIENAALQSKLVHELSGRSLKLIDGAGMDSQGKWPHEASFLVFGLSLEASRTLARKYEQNAFIWSGKNAVPQLILGID